MAKRLKRVLVHAALPYMLTVFCDENEVEFFDRASKIGGVSQVENKWVNGERAVFIDRRYDHLAVLEEVRKVEAFVNGCPFVTMFGWLFKVMVPTSGN